MVPAPHTIFPFSFLFALSTVNCVQLQVLVFPEAVLQKDLLGDDAKIVEFPTGRDPPESLSSLQLLPQTSKTWSVVLYFLL